MDPVCPPMAAAAAIPPLPRAIPSRQLLPRAIPPRELLPRSRPSSPPSPGPSPPNSGKHGAGQVCQIYGDGVGTAVDGELFAACDVCGFPLCRPCYEYERKDGTEACPQCKTKYKRHQGSPPIHGEENEDVDVDDVSDYNYQSGNQDQEQKIAERMLTNA